MLSPNRHYPRMSVAGFLRTLIVFSIALLLTGNGPSSQGLALSRDVPRPSYEGLVAKAENGGSVPVIVGLKLPKLFQAEGYLDGPQAVQEQRTSIKRAQASLLADLSGLDVTLHAAYDMIPYIALRVDGEALQALIASPLVDHIEEDVPVPPALASSVPLIGADVVWDEGADGSGWAVAVLDTGVQWDHDFFGGAASSRVVSEACYSHSGTGETTLCPNGLTSQETGHAADPAVAACDNSGTNICTHGTHVAGIAAGDGASYDGVAPGASIIAIQIFTRFASAPPCSTAPCVLTYTSDQISGLERVYALRTTYNIAAVNMSLGGGSYSDYCDTDSRKTIIDSLWSAGIATAISTGNDGYTAAIGAPACISSAVAVGATTDSDTVASFSNSSTMVDLLAPGVGIDSSVPGNGYGTMSGTSMAAPHVAGAWALLKSVAPGATPAEILAALQDTGISVTDTRNGVTKPRIQLDAAAALVGPATWLGNTPLWSSAANWDTGAVPGRTAHVTIPSVPDGGSFPTVDVNAAVYDLTIESGAQLNMASNTLDVYGDWMVQGTGAFSATGGTVVMKGSRDQAIQMTGNASDHFYSLQIGDGSTSQTVAAGSDLNVDGDLEIMDGTSLDGGAYTIEVAGSWADHGGGFIPNASTVVLDGTTQNAENTGAAIIPVYSNDLSSTTDWTVNNANGDFDAGREGTASTWYASTSMYAPNSPDSGRHGRYYYNTDRTTGADDWLFSPGVTLEAGTTYAITLNYGAASAFYPERLGVYIGNANAIAAMSYQVFDDNSVTNTSWQQGSGTYTPGTAGTYYVGFYAYSAPDMYELAVDDLAIVTGGNSDLTFYNLIVSSTGSGNLSDDVVVENNLTINSGATMNLGMYKITSVGGTFANNGTLSSNETYAVTSGSGTQTFGDAQSNDAATIAYLGGDEPGSTTVTTRVGTTIPADAFGAGCPAAPNAVRRYYNVTAADSDGLNVTLRLYYDDAELNGNAEASLEIWHCEGGSWVNQGGTVSTSSNYVEATVTSFSPFVLSGGSPTAVDLVRFQASRDGTTVRLEWETATEIDVLGFNLYRAEHPAGPPARLNDSLIPSKSPGAPLGAAYSYVDQVDAAGTTYYYWLEDVDVHGVATRHGPISPAPQHVTAHRAYLPLVGHR